MDKAMNPYFERALDQYHHAIEIIETKDLTDEFWVIAADCYLRMAEENEWMSRFC